MGMDNEFYCIFSAVIRYISSTGEIDVGVILLFKNPLSLPHQGILPSLLVPFGQLHFRYGPRISLDSFSSTGEEMECKMGEMLTRNWR